MFLHTKTKQFDLSKRTLVMGILNITPDSFSDGGKYNSIDEAIIQAKRMVEEGADIIDVGGESTRPDHQPITEEEEIHRVVPVIEAIKEYINVPISIDTYKAKTAEEAINAGAEIINDIWGAKWDENMAKVAADYQVPIILMHNRDNKVYNNLIEELIDDLNECITIVKESGVKEEQIILDPGIGFGKDLKDNYQVLQNLGVIKERLPYPMLLGTSRKSFINEVLDLKAEERDNATGATTCLGISMGANIVRVHDVKRHAELAKMCDAILTGGENIG